RDLNVTGVQTCALPISLCLPSRPCLPSLFIASLLLLHDLICLAPPPPYFFSRFIDHYETAWRGVKPKQMLSRPLNKAAAQKVARSEERRVGKVGNTMYG